MVRAPLVNDLAVAASYQLEPGADPLAPAIRFAAAYHAVSPLQEAELDVLFDLMMARLAMVVAIGGWRARYPDNADYPAQQRAVLGPPAGLRRHRPRRRAAAVARGLRFSIGSQP